MRDRLAGRRVDDGAAAVEFALVLPILCLLLFGIVDFGRLLSAQIVVTDAAREAARASSLVSAAQAQTVGAQAAASLDPSLLHVTVVTDCSGTSTATEDTTVTVTYDFHFVTPVVLALGFGDSNGMFPISSTSVMPCLR